MLRRARAAGAAAPPAAPEPEPDRADERQRVVTGPDRLAETHVERAVRERSRLRVVLATGASRAARGARRG